MAKNGALLHTSPYYNQIVFYTHLWDNSTLISTESQSSEIDVKSLLDCWRIRICNLFFMQLKW
jgi:hypothetical protein